MNTIKIGFLGFGKMATSILKGILSKGLYHPEEIAFYAPSKASQEKGLSLGLNLANDERELFLRSPILILALKPQKYDEIFQKLKGLSFEGKTIISLAPGKSISQLKEKLPKAKIARAMPNTPALIQKAMTTLSFEEEPIPEVGEIFSSIGDTLIVEEKMIEETIPIQGSLPAYLFYFAKGFLEKAKEHGIKEEEAKKLLFHSIIGSSYLALETNEDIDTLIENVCSKGGSTIEGLNQLKEKGFLEAVEACYDACVKRSKELSKA